MTQKLFYILLGLRDESCKFGQFIGGFIASCLDSLEVLLLGFLVSNKAYEVLTEALFFSVQIVDIGLESGEVFHLLNNSRALLLELFD